MPFALAAFVTDLMRTKEYFHQSQSILDAENSYHYITEHYKTASILLDLFKPIVA